MTSISSLMSLVLLVMMMMMMMSISVVQSGPRNIVRRQVSDSNHLNDNSLTGCFAALALGHKCNNTESDDINEVELGPKPDKEGCKCVPHTKCRDIKITVPTLDGNDQSFIDLRTSCQDSGETCCIDIDLGMPPKKMPSHTPRCGQRNPLGSTSNTFLGIGVNKAQFGQYPWMAAVMTSGTPGLEGTNVYVCGGSLIHPKVVLTTVHNIEGKEAQDLSVRLGDWDLKTTTEQIKQQDIKVEYIVRHPDYVHSGRQLEYDVALLVLDSEAVLGLTVDTICLPDPFETFDRISCFTSGWGKDTFEDGKFQEIMKSLKLPVVSHSQCQDALRQTRLGSSYILHKSFICAGGQLDVDACTGDGGSPLVCPMKNDPSSYVQAGLVAWGIGCGKDGLPGVYASVSEVVEWIEGEIPAGLDLRRKIGQEK